MVSPTGKVITKKAIKRPPFTLFDVFHIKNIKQTNKQTTKIAHINPWKYFCCTVCPYWSSSIPLHSWNCLSVVFLRSFYSHLTYRQLFCVFSLLKQELKYILYVYLPLLSHSGLQKEKWNGSNWIIGPNAWPSERKCAALKKQMFLFTFRCRQQFALFITTH